MSDEKHSGRYPWLNNDYSWVWNEPVFMAILDKMLNQQFVRRNDIFMSFGIPANVIGNSIITNANEFLLSFETANDMCQKIYGCTLKEKCELDKNR